MPRFLDRTGRDEWRRIVPELEALGLLARCDRAALAAYCASYARWAKAERALRRGGNDAEIIKSPNGAFIQSAWVGIANRALHMMHRYLTEFGLSPSARARLATPQPGTPNDPAEKYFA
jgi:P27 family predicted phage terminase small subunit